MMTQIAWENPKFTIGCMLADGCVLECEEDGHTLTTPDRLRR